MTNEIITVMGRSGTVYILEYLHTHKKPQYTDLLESINAHTLNVRLRELLKLHLIEHHLVRTDTRKEWYEITEKGEKVLQLIQKLLNYTTKILRVLSLTGTVYILEYIHTHEKTHYMELRKTIAPNTLNMRLRELLHLELIEHHFKRAKTRKEWYTITENGEKVFQIMKELQKISKNSV